MTQGTIDVFVNPYAAIDHASRLSGVCGEGEPVRDGSVLSVFRLLGASREVLDYRPLEVSTKPDSPGLRPSRTKFRIVYTAQPVTVPFTGELRAYYLERLRERTLFEVVGPGEVKVYDHTGKSEKKSLLAALADARLRAFQAYRANYGGNPDVTEWAEQFPPDADVAEAMKPLDAEAQKKAEEAAAKAKQAATSAPKPQSFPLIPPAPQPTASSSSSAKAAKSGANT